MSDRRGKKLADFFPLYFSILKVVEKRGCRMEEGRISFQQGFKEFLVMIVSFWIFMFLMYGESLLQ
ncbi:hypothetical protein U9R71_30070 [Bacillus toyonensis]|uniref:hypothetical protein n=1 Tax=Bacillus TaxID=1386 RepID=UPI000BF23BAF|nr:MULTISPECIES: hypothetical protein [Bacillus]MBJ8067881.1 hypothetical protein [Bacillus cereus group sp. N15]MCS3599144.1 hypothetical protein [Bacillus sp. JUb91]PEJ00524.1 hypothetical protein CN671_19840 [Bacillus toyonensis]QWI08473.1 hypothetical protein EXW54_27895 [Bacillus toyonensis]HDR7386346.1 hypothetical protein [Bacillus toyonensis]